MRGKNFETFCNDRVYRRFVERNFEIIGEAMNRVLKLNPKIEPFFTCSNNEDLILAIQSAGVSRGRNGFHKDKSGEN